jgi:hypothetical protein
MSDDEGYDRVSAAKAFEREMFAGVETLKREIGYPANRFLQMLHELGGVGTAQRLLAKDDLTTSGFTRLWEAKRLHQSMEFFVLQDEYQELFTPDERQRAWNRLLLHDFPRDRLPEP